MLKVLLVVMVAAAAALLWFLPYTTYISDTEIDIGRSTGFDRSFTYGRDRLTGNETIKFRGLGFNHALLIRYQYSCGCVQEIYKVKGDYSTYLSRNPNGTVYVSTGREITHSETVPLASVQTEFDLALAKLKKIRDEYAPLDTYHNHIQ